MSQPGFRVEIGGSPLGILNHPKHCTVLAEGFTAESRWLSLAGEASCLPVGLALLCWIGLLGWAALITSGALAIPPSALTLGSRMAGAASLRWGCCWLPWRHNLGPNARGAPVRLRRCGSNLEEKPFLC
jgi:hypothetical protein